VKKITEVLLSLSLFCFKVLTNSLHVFILARNIEGTEQHHKTQRKTQKSQIQRERRSFFKFKQK